MQTLNPENRIVHEFYIFFMFITNLFIFSYMHFQKLWQNDLTHYLLKIKVFLRKYPFIANQFVRQQGLN